MLDIAVIETRPAILLCAYADEEAAQGDDWAPPGARIVRIAGGDPEGLAERLSERLAQRDCRALLLVGRHQGEGFCVQMRALNHGPDGAPRATTGPSIARATAPVTGILQALRDEGLPVAVSSECDEDVGSYLLYRVLTALPHDVDVPAVGLLRASRTMDSETVQRGVRAAASAIANRLSPLQR